MFRAFLVVMIVVAMAGTVWAKETAGGKSACSQAKEAAAAPEAKKGCPAQAECQVCVGKVVSVDAAAKSMVIKCKKCEMTVATDKVKLTRGGKKIKAADIKVGDKVTVKCKNAKDKMEAEEVSLDAPAAAKPEAEKK